MRVTWTFFLGIGQTVKCVYCLMAKNVFLVPFAIIELHIIKLKKWLSFRKKFNLYQLLRGVLPFQTFSGEQLPLFASDQLTPMHDF